MTLTADQVRWVAHLARLDLSDSEIASITPQLRAILDYVTQLQQVDTAGIEPMAHPLPIHNVFREDESQPSLSVDAALANAPVRHDVFYSVPAVLD